MVIEIKEAQHLNDYKIQFTFNDGNISVVDFGPFLNKAQNPMTNQFLDIKKFRDFHIEYGDIMWGDFELCFPIADIYDGKI